MTALTLDFSAASDVNPYIFPAGWTVIKDSFKVQSNSLRSVFSDTGQSMVITDNPAASGLLDVSLTVVQNSTTFNDWSGMLFVNATGNGFGVEVRDAHIYLVNIVTGAYASSLGNIAGLVYSSGAEFRATYDLDINEINVYQLTTAPGVPTPTPGTPIFTVSGLTPQSNMAGGLWVVWENGNAAGIITASVDGFASLNTIDSITTDGNPGIVVGEDFEITTTGLGTFDTTYIDTLSTPAAAVAAPTVAPGGDGTGAMPFWVDGGYYPFIGAVRVTVTDPLGNSASGNFTLSLPPNYASVTFSSVVTSDNTYVGYWLDALGHPLANGDIGYYINIIPGNSLVVAANTKVSIMSSLVFTLIVHKLSGIIESYSIAVNDSGEITGGTAITSRSIISRSIISRKITSRAIV